MGHKPELALRYDEPVHPPLRWGYNDLNRDGAPDTLIAEWNGKTIAFVSDDGRLPWGPAEEGRDWNAYFNEAFSVGREPPETWNPVRSTWGNYTILVDRDGCGRFDSRGDFFYKAIDLNGDGAPEAECYHLFPAPGESTTFSNKLHVGLDGDREMSLLDWKSFFYGDEQRYLEGGKYVANVHGSGFFLNSYSELTQRAWENPIAWYDFDGDGRTNMVIRAADVFPAMNFKGRGETYHGRLNEFEVAFELNGNTSASRWHSLDMQLTFYNYRRGEGLDYLPMKDRVPHLEPLKGAEFLSAGMALPRHEPVRRYLPYLDAYRLGMDFDGWEGVWLLFDEDDDDNRWEEMFSRHEPADWHAYSDRLGDRTEIDHAYRGRGRLYVGRFDGRIHLHGADFAMWEIDYLGLYKGAADRAATDEGPEPPAGLRYPRVRYLDTTGNGFIDRIEYSTVEYRAEDRTERIERTISLLDYADAECPAPDECELLDPRVDAPLTGWSLERWDGRPLTAETFRGSPVRAGYERMCGLYSRVCEAMWADAVRLYEIAKSLGLNRSENLDRDLRERYTKQELAALKELTVPQGYSRHLWGRTPREKYHNGFWLREKVFQDIVAHSGLDRFTLEKLFYTRRIEELCRYLSR
jgi:hypothetical protein